MPGYAPYRNTGPRGRVLCDPNCAGVFTVARLEAPNESTRTIMNTFELRSGLNSAEARLKQKQSEFTDEDRRRAVGRHDELLDKVSGRTGETRDSVEYAIRESGPLSPAMPAPTAGNIQILNPLETPDWDARVRHFRTATFFHSAAWARVLHVTYGYQPVYFATGDANRIHSLLPMMEVKSWLTGRRGVALPFTDECEPLVPDLAAFPPLFAAAQAQGKVRRWKYLECRGSRAALADVPTSASFYDHRLELQPDESALFATFDGNARRNVRKAEQSGLTIEFSQSLESMQAFYGLLCMTRQRHGVPPQPFRFFANIQRHVLAEKQGWVVLARQGKVPVAGAIFFHFGQSVIFKFSASNKDFQHLRANNLVIWHAIRHYAREGFTSLHFGRTSLNNEGLRRFKLSWGTQERKSQYMRRDLKAERFVIADDQASGWHTRVFQRMPSFISQLIGALLYRHMG